jgi:hypothetical protein
VIDVRIGRGTVSRWPWLPVILAADDPHADAGSVVIAAIVVGRAAKQAMNAVSPPPPQAWISSVTVAR